MNFDEFDGGEKNTESRTDWKWWRCRIFQQLTIWGPLDCFPNHYVSVLSSIFSPLLLPAAEPPTDGWRRGDKRRGKTNGSPGRRRQARLWSQQKASPADKTCVLKCICRHFEISVFLHFSTAQLRSLVNEHQHIWVEASEWQHWKSGSVKSHAGEKWERLIIQRAKNEKGAVL